MTPRLSSAPVTWGVWELTIDRHDLVAPEAMLAAVRGLDYSGIELGPLGYFGATPEAVFAELDAHGLELSGAFVELHLADAEAFERDVPLLDTTLAVLAQARGRAPVILADAGSPERREASGRPAELRATTLDNSRFAGAMDRLAAALQRAAEAGVPATFHPHAATYVETRDETERLLEMTDSELGICVDTGHAAIGGMDALELAAACGERMTHLHLKDVDPGVRSRLAAGEVDIDSAWEQGLFCPFGEGEVDLEAFLSLPFVRSFGGWVVTEQDRVRVRPADLEAVRAVERRNRERVLAWAEWDG